jgi:hypothetical protein
MTQLRPSSNAKMQSRRRVFIAILGFLFLGSVTGLTQTTTDGSIYGRVHDASGAVVAGAQIVAHSLSVGGEFKAVSDDVGDYRLKELPPAENYTLEVQQPGFDKYVRTGLVVEAGLSVTIDIPLKVGSQSQTVEVSGDAPLIETQSAEQSVNLSGDLLRNLPLSGRHEWSDALQVTPGIISASSDAEGGQTYFLRGSENENHATLLDGVDIGSFEQNWPSNTISIGNESLGDIQIKTGANDASSPAAMGMVINLASPTGGDQFHGSVVWLIGPTALNANNSPGGTAAYTETEQPDFALGGPIEKNRAWFFFSGRYIDRNEGISQTSAQLTDLQDFVSEFKPFPNHSNGFIYLGNATVQLSERHRLTGIVQHDSRVQDANYQWYAGNYAISQYGGGAYGLRLLSQWNQRLATRFLVSYNNKGVNPTASSAGGVGALPEEDIYTTDALSAGKLVGQGSSLATLNNLQSIGLNPASKPTAGGDLTYFIPKAWGSHELLAGFYLEPHESSKVTTLYANNGTLIQEDAVLNNASNPALGYTIFHQESVSSPSVLSSYITANDFAWYVQDHWRPTTRLSINAGLRPDWVLGRDAQFKVTTQHSWNYAPRVGVDYSLSRNQTNILRASWSKITDITNASYLGTAGTSTLTETDKYLENGSWVSFVTPGSTALTPGKSFDPHRHQGYVREWTVGYRTQLPGELVLDASFINREYRDRPAEYDTNQIYTTTASGTVWSGLVNPALNNTYYVTNDKWNWFVYQGIEFTASKQTSKVRLFGTYSYSPDHLAGTWQPNDPAAIIEPTKFANNAGIGSVRGYVTNDYTGDTRNRMWQRNQLRTGITVKAPFKIRASTSFTAQSGTPGGPVITTLTALGETYSGQYGPSTLPVTYNGVTRNVSNPLATTNRFAYANRGDGQIWCPWLLQWDALAGREFHISDRHSVEADVNFYNILNGGAAQQFVNGNNIASSTFGSLQNIQLPRSAQFSVRYHF